MKSQGYRYAGNTYCRDCKPVDPQTQTSPPLEFLGPAPTCTACGKRWVPVEWLEAGGTWVEPDPRPAHTPGPWATCSRSPNGTYTITAGVGVSVGTVAGLVTTEADARLIAAAPELLNLAQRYAHRLTSDERRWLDEIS